MAKLTSPKIIELGQKIDELRSTLFSLESEKEKEFQKLFCEAENLVPDKSIIQEVDSKKEYLFHCAVKGVTNSSERPYHTTNVMGYLKLKSGKFSFKLTEVYRHWEKKGE